MYIKTGIVTKIIFNPSNKKQVNFLNNNFNLDLYTLKNNTYYIKYDILKNNFWSFHKEYLSFTNYKYDSIDDCCAYALEINLDSLKKRNIILTNNFEGYTFEGFDYIFHMDHDQFLGINIYFISIYWNINKISCEDFTNIKVLSNNLCRKAVKNILKNASWFTII